MKARVAGVGWVTSTGAGQGWSGLALPIPDGNTPPPLRSVAFDKSYQRYARMDAFTKIGVTALALALNDSGMDAWEEKRRVGVIAGTRASCVGADVDYYRTALEDDGALASPQIFSYTLPSTFVGEAAIQFGLTGPGHVIIDNDDPGAKAIDDALAVLEDGDADAMIAGWVDGAKVSEEPAPLIANGQTGAVFVVLTREGDGIELERNELAGRVFGELLSKWQNAV